MKKNTIICLFMSAIAMFGCGNNSNSNKESTPSISSSEIVDYGTLSFEDMRIYYNYPGVAPTPIFSNSNYTGEITYTINNETAVKYENGVFVALKPNFRVLVTATTPYHKATFKIQTLEMAYEDQVKAHENKWVADGSPEGSTLFVGDSFFDTYFWSDFYSTYGKYNTRTHGIGGTTTTDWEVFASRLIYPVNPKNIVMHCGTNNLFDDLKTAEVTIEETTRLLDTLHEKYPETKFYYFGIEPRTGAIRGLNFADSIQRIHDTNAGIIEYCNKNTSWLTYLDSPSLCYYEDGSVKADFFRDGCHPTLESYSHYVRLLEEAGLEMDINENLTREIPDFETELTTTVGASQSLIYLGTPLKKEFSVKFKIDVLERANNSHIEIRFGDHTDRFLFWDSGSNGKYQMGYAVGGNYVSSAPERSVYTKLDGETLTLDIELVVTSNNAYLYVNNILELIYLNLPTYGSVMVGSEATKAKFYDFEAKTKADDINDYNNVVVREEIKKYENLGGGEGLAIARGTLSGSTILRDYNDFVVNKSDTFNLAGIGENDSNYTSSNRDYAVSLNGNNMLTGDFVFSYEFKVLNKDYEEVDTPSSANVSSQNFFHILTVSNKDNVDPWNQQHLLYWKQNESCVKIANLGSGSAVNQENVEDVTIECKAIRSAEKVYVAMCANDVWYVSEATYDINKEISIWLSSANINVQITNLKYSLNSNEINNAKAIIGK